MRQTDRSIDSRDTDGVFALHAAKNGWPPHLLERQWASVGEAQLPKVGQQCLMHKGSGGELCRSGDFGSFIDDSSERTEERRSPLASLPIGDRDFGITRELPEFFRPFVEHTSGGADEHPAILTHT